MNFKEKTDEAPYMEWCVVETPLYCPSGFHIAQWNGKFWENEFGEDISEYVDGWCLL